MRAEDGWILSGRAIIIIIFKSVLQWMTLSPMVRDIMGACIIHHFGDIRELLGDLHFLWTEKMS